MNKANLIKQVSEKTNIELKAAKVIVDTFFDAMRESLEKGDRIEIRGFGTFVVSITVLIRVETPKLVRLSMSRLRNSLTSKLEGK
jgi:nucleoid DNA-binding protein